MKILGDFLKHYFFLFFMYSFSPSFSEREDEGSRSEVSVCTEEVSEGRFWGRPEGIQGAPGFPVSQPVPLPPQNQCMSTKVYV